MCRGVERDGVKVGNMPDLVLALRASVLTGHHVPAQVDGNGMGAVHSAFLGFEANTLQPGCLDLQAFTQHGWKTSARVEDVRVQYEGQSRILDEQVTAR